MNAEWSDRLEHWIRVLKKDFYEPLGEISWSVFLTREQIPPEELEKEKFVPVSPGFTWGHTWEYGWFHSEIQLPDCAKGKRIVLNLEPDGESTLFVNGKAFGTYRASWVSCPHQFYEDNVLIRCAQGGETYDLLMETYAGHYFPCEPDTAETGPILPESPYQDPLEEGKRRTLGVCTFGIFQEEAYQLYMDVDTLCKLYRVLDPFSLRAVRIAKALKNFTLTVDFEQEREKRVLSYQKARQELKAVLEAENGSTVPKMYAVGNAHIDLAWLWPLEETRRKTARTFAAQLRLMEEYPEYRYIQSQPAAYEMCREQYPELFERIREAVKKGQWIAEGAMWAEPDTNLTGGESLIRQILYGKKYYREVFGVESELLWLPDSFGYSAALPQILKGCGVRYLVTQKIFASYNNYDEERFPYHYFNWEGIDGTRITSFLPTSYLYQTHPEELVNVWKNRVQEDLEAFLLPYGYGDGGGGPARDHLEYAGRLKNLEGCPKVQLAGPNEFFRDMEELQGPPENTYVGELYFCAHRGTYTTQANVKKNNRECELALREMEFWSSQAVLRGMPYDAKRAERLWKTLLLNQFHDILPGSSIARVYEEAEKEVRETIREAREMEQSALNWLADPEETEEAVTVLNALSFERTELVSLPETFERGARTAEGCPVPVQKNALGVRALVSMPPCGAVTLYPEKLETFSEKQGAVVRRTEKGLCMENGEVAVTLNGKGEIVSFIRKSTGKEFASGPMNRLHLYKDVPRHFDAWDLDSNYVLQETEGASDVRMEILTEGLEAAVRVSGRIGVSEYSQVIRLAADSGLVEVEMEIEWKELHRLLKTAFPTVIHGQNGINEIQFGFVERPAHRSRQFEKDRFEVCNHRYSAFCDAASGAAVFNDCKYGISMEEGTLSLTLLRAAAAPAMRTDNGKHSFRYGFLAWEGSFLENAVPAQAFAFNVRPQIRTGRIRSFDGWTIDRSNILLDTVKPAEDGSGDLIFRFYEACRADTTARISGMDWALGACLCNMLEEPGEELAVRDGALTLHFRPFEIKTIRMRKEKNGKEIPGWGEAE
ncbi:MAG: glycoside hydrolase family 38 C-terminal domain-containing protein [Candidatus Limivivens sp.]|nr:glycoside hydrolase family 38 C-terminal domain-containing protein [Candidatus Limivivens sp.]